jgi:hypothetical protein
VFSKVLSPSECTQTINEMWDVVEGFCGGRLGIHRDDPSTWCNRWPGGGPGFLGEATSPQAWRNRANPNLRKAFETVLGTTEIVSSLDNYGMLRPTKRVPMGKLPVQVPCRTDVVYLPTDPYEPTQAESADADISLSSPPQQTKPVKIVDMNDWVTKSKWLHWDMNPFRWVDESMPPYNFSEFGWISENNGAPRGTARFKVDPPPPSSYSNISYACAYICAYLYDLLYIVVTVCIHHMWISSLLLTSLVYVYDWLFF